MLKRIFSVLLVIALFSGICSIGTFAQDDYNTSKIAYFTGSPETEVTSISPDVTITAKVKVKASGTAAATGKTFLLMLYRDSALESVAVGTESTSGTATMYSATLTMPSDVTGCELNAVLWDSLKDMNAVCSSSIFPGTEKELLSLKVNGEEVLDEFDENNELTFMLPLGETKMPLLTYKTVDNGAKVEITNPTTRPGNAKIKVTSSDGTLADEYTVKYMYEAPSSLISEADASVEYDGTRYKIHAAHRKGVHSVVPENARYTVADVYATFSNSEPTVKHTWQHIGYYDIVVSNAPSLKNDGLEHRITYVIDFENFVSYAFVDGLLKSACFISESITPYTASHYTYHTVNFGGDIMTVKSAKEAFYTSELKLSDIGLYGAKAVYDETNSQYEITHELGEIRNRAGDTRGVGYDNGILIKGSLEGTEKFEELTGYVYSNKVSGGSVTSLYASSDAECDEMKLSTSETVSGKTYSIELDVMFKSGYDKLSDEENPYFDLEF